MLEFKTRLVAPAFVVLAGFALGGCSYTQNGPKYPPDPSTAAVANFNIASGFLPYPADPFFFVGSTDGTLNLPSIAFRAESMRAALNSQDGWSTSAVIDTSFTQPLDPTSISGSTVKMVEIYVDPRNKAPANPADATTQQLFLPTGQATPVIRPLTYGTDFTAAPCPDDDSGGMRLCITPLKPLQYSSGPAYNTGAGAGKFLNIGYIVVLTNGLKSTAGAAMTSDTEYAAIKAAPANCSTITDPTLNQICQFTKPQLSIAQATGTDPATIILSWSFSTQSVDDTFAVLEATATPQQTLIVPTGLNTHQVNAGFAGHADVYVGSTVLPYYLTPAANNHDSASVNTKFWTAAGPPPAALGLDQSSRNLTMFNPMPAKVATVTVPLVVTIPNASSKCPAKPAGGWPVAVVQHGITGNRSQALTMSDAFADACFIVAAIDLPLHGITDTTSPLYCTPAIPQCIGASERTFDLVGADGKILPSGTYYINLTSPATGRDNNRESEADLLTFEKSISTLAIAPGTPAPAGPVGVDATRVHFVGLSLGAIVGGAHAEASKDIRTATLAVPGGVLTQLLNDSQTFGPLIKSQINAQLTPGSYLYNLFLRDAQAVVDSGDPINHIKDASKNHPVHMIKVIGDTVVPNNSTDRLITAASLKQLHSGVTAVGPGTGAFVAFLPPASHGSLFDPTTSLAATIEMQSETVLFAASAVAAGGPFVTITNPAVVQQ